MYRFMTLIRKAYGGLEFPIYIIFISTIINRMGGFVFAFLTILLTNKLNYSSDTIANYIIITGIVSGISPIIGGYLGDRYSRKKTYIYSTLVGALFFVLCGIFTHINLQVIPFLLIAASFFISINGPIINAMVADKTKNDDERTKAFSLIYMGVNLGVAIGPLIGGRLIANYLDIFFYFDAATTFISLFLIHYFVKESKPEEEEIVYSDAGEGAEKGNPLLVLFRRPFLLSFLLLSLPIVLLYAQSTFGLPLQIERAYGKELAPTLSGNLMALNAIVVVFGSFLLNNYNRSHDTLNNLFLGGLLTTIGFGMLGFFTYSMPLYYISVVIWTLGEIFNKTNSNVYIMKHTPMNYRARFGGIFDITRGVAIVLSPKYMARLLRRYSPKMSWTVFAIFSMIATIGLLILKFVEDRKEKSLKK